MATPGTKAPETRRKKLDTLRTMLDTERSRYKTLWREIADFIRPYRLQLEVTDTNQKDLRNPKIINNTASMASRTMASGMMAGITSPSRPWKKLSTADTELAKLPAVKQWLHDVNELMDIIFLRSNLYNVLPTTYGDLGDFGVGAILVEEDFETVVRFQVLPIGSYSLALNDKLEVDVFFREFRLTVRQTVEKFGIRGEDGKLDMSNFSSAVIDNYKDDMLDIWVDICHVIQRNKDHNPKNLESKPYQSVYFEKGVTSNTSASNLNEPDKFLRDKGYDRFPVLAPRWETTGEDVYGNNSPGITALGDIKALQTLEKRKGQAIDKSINPPLMGPSSLKHAKISLLPGDLTYIDNPAGMDGLKPVHEVRTDIGAVAAEIREHEFRIKRSYFEDLFLMLASSDRRQITATEVMERKEEKLLALGPVLQHLNQDLLDPLIDITFDMMVKQNRVPDPPEELQGMALKVEYISIMHEAQKLAGLASIERLTQYVGEVSTFQPDALDKLDVDELIDEYAKIVGVPPNIIRPDEVVQAIREARQQAIAQQQQAEQLKLTAGATKDLASVDTSGPNALTELKQQSEAGALQ